MIIKAENLNFKYGEQKVLNDINFSVEAGNLITLIGPNGSGKTTLLKCINNYLEPERGSIQIKDKKIEEFGAEELAKIIAYVPQHEEYIFNMDVFNTVLMGRKAHSGWKANKEDKKIAAQVISSLNLSEIAFKKLNNLSGGQKQKVFVARALAQQSEIILLDEPTSNLDLKHQLEIMELIKKEVKMGKTAVVTLHDLSLVSRFSDRIIMLKEGRIYSDGSKGSLSAEKINSVYGVEVSLKDHRGNSVIIPEKVI